MASTFVTVSWNTSRSLSSHYLLQVEHTPVVNEDSLSPSTLSDKTAFKNVEKPLFQFDNINVGLKMNSYTVSGLDPGNTYTFLLCMRKNSFIIPISMTTITTKNSNFMKELGIVKDYTAVALIVLVLSSGFFICVGICGCRIFKLRLSQDQDSISTKEMIPSTSEQSSVGQGNPGEIADQSRLVDHEVSSPVEEIADTFT